MALQWYLPIASDVGKLSYSLSLLHQSAKEINLFLLFAALSKKKPGRPQRSSPELASNPMANRSTNQQTRSPVQSANRENRSHVQARAIANHLVRNHSSGSSSPAEEVSNNLSSYFCEVESWVLYNVFQL